LRTLAAGLCLAAAVAIWALLAGRFGETSVRILLSALTAMLCTLAALAGTTALRRGGSCRQVGQLTIGLAQVALLLALVLIWVPGATDGEMPLRSLGVAIVLTLAGCHASLLLSKISALDTRAVKRLSLGAIACASSAGLLLGGLFALNDGPVASGVWRLLGVLVVLALLNTLLAALARRSTRPCA
jgi:hypothetical protein